MYGFSPAPVREETVSTLTVEETEELLLALLKSAIESIIQHSGDSVKDNLTFLHFSGSIRARRSNGEEEQTEIRKAVILLYCPRPCSTDERLRGRLPPLPLSRSLLAGW